MVLSSLAALFSFLLRNGTIVDRKTLSSYFSMKSFLLPGSPKKQPAQRAE